MHTALRAATAVAASLLLPGIALTQEPEAFVSKSEISVHRVERGKMPLRETASGFVASLSPPRVTVSLSPQQRRVVRVGQTCSVQVAAPAVLRCTVALLSSDTAREPVATLEMTDAFGPGSAINDPVGALIDVGVTDTVIYFDRPRSARPNTTSTIFVIEPDGGHAKRVRVLYGRLSGAQLEIISGLAPGDRVIVTNLPAVAGRDRIALK